MFFPDVVAIGSEYFVVYLLCLYNICSADCAELPVLFFFQAEDGIRDRSPSRGLGDVYKRQVLGRQQ